MIKELHVADVGDGLCLKIFNEDNRNLMVDCGSKSSPPRAGQVFWELTRISAPDTFLLSHFHEDHFNGLAGYLANGFKRNNVKMTKIYIPRIPDFSQNSKDQDDLRCFFIMMNAMSRWHRVYLEIYLAENVKEINYDGSAPDVESVFQGCYLSLAYLCCI